jgi:hypothetical protein
MNNKKDVDIVAVYMERIRNAPEREIISGIGFIRWSFKIFHGNYIELIKLLKVIEDRPESIKLWDVKKRRELYRVFEEIGRLFFNYLAAAFMLIDHTRRHVAKVYKDAKYSAFKEEYKREVRERFGDNDNHQIAKGLRNYIQHRNLPTVGSKIIYTPETGLNKTLRIPMDSLLEWDGWSHLARKKLRAMGESFKISKFVEEYFHQVETFYKWLWERQVEMHKEDIERLNMIKQEAKKALMDAGIITEKELQEYIQQFD